MVDVVRETAEVNGSSFVCGEVREVEVSLKPSAKTSTASTLFRCLGCGQPFKNEQPDGTFATRCPECRKDKP